MSSFIRICQMWQWFKECFKYCGLVICVNVSWFCLYSSIFLFVSFWVQLWGWLWGVCVCGHVEGLDEGRRFECLLFCEALSVVFVLYLQQFQPWVDVLVFLFGQTVNVAKICLFQLPSFCRVCEYSSLTGLRLTSLVLRI